MEELDKCISILILILLGNCNMSIMSIPWFEEMCPDLAPVFNASLTPLSGPYEWGDTVTYSCAYGYIMTAGSPNRTCHDNFGGWTGQAPVCSGMYITVVIRKGACLL